MIDVTVIRRDGSQAAISAISGANLMETLRDAGIDDILALCGGCCSCATCHVYIEDAPEGVGNTASEDENDLLDSSDHRQANSRLACQVRVSESMRVRIAPED